MHNSQARGQDGRPIAVPMIADAFAHGEKQSRLLSQVPV